MGWGRRQRARVLWRGLGRGHGPALAQGHWLSSSERPAGGKRREARLDGWVTHDMTWSWPTLDA